MSGWRQRPLQVTQLFYAAQDAYVTRHACIVMAGWLVAPPSLDSPEIQEKLDHFKEVVVKENPKYEGPNLKRYFDFNPVLPPRLKRLVKKVVQSIDSE